MTTKNGNQRIHLVLAENYPKAKPILDRLRINGLQPRNRVYVTDETNLLGLKSERVAIIFGPDYSGNPKWSRMQQTIYRMLHEGAVKKADPEAEFQKREAERRAEAQRKADAVRAKAAEAVRRIDQGLVDIPTGGLWDQIKGPGGVYTGNAPFIEYAKTHIGYKRYYVGGPHHGKRCKDFPAADGGEVVLKQTFGAAIVKDSYLAYTAEILGQPVLFWVHEGSWSDRQRLVRDFVLMPLEV